jgi:hypothetical protein
MSKRDSNAARIARRRFLLGIGGVTLALPLLPSLTGESFAGSAPKKAKRFVFLFTSNGQRPENWYPADPSNWTDRAANVREASLSQYRGGMSRVFGPEFDSLLPKMVLFRGLDSVNSTGGGHNAATPLNASRVLPFTTIDQVLAQSSKVYQSAPPVRSVHLLVKQAFQSATSVSVDGSLESVEHQTSTAAAYQKLFGGFVPPDDSVGKQRIALRQSVLDSVRDEYDVLRESSRLGADDRARLENHMDLIADLRDRIGATGAQCALPRDPGEIGLESDDNLLAATDAHIDMLTAAFACDRTRVATLMLCPGTDLRDFGSFGGPSGDHHAISHDAVYNPDSADALGYINNWYAKRVASFLSKLDSIVEDPDTGATLLDNSIVYWGNEDGCNGYDAHPGWAMPTMLAGGGGGAIQTGRYIDYRTIGKAIQYDGGGGPADQPTDYIGRPLNSLLISLMQAMGLEPQDYETGGAGYGDYSDIYNNQYSVSDGQQPLPFLAG